MTDFFSDFRVSDIGGESTTKLSLALNATGDIQLSVGAEKLTSQIIKAIVNDNTMTRQVLNSPKAEQLIPALITTILRNFKQSQIDEVGRSSSDFSGFSIFRKAAGTDESFIRVSDQIIDWRFIDTGLKNDVTYTYGITRVIRKVFESSFIDQLDVTPSALQSRQEIVIGKSAVAMPTSRQVTFYVDGPKKYKASELLENVVSIDVSQDETEPRKWIVNIVVENLLGEQLSLSASSFDLRA
jgi:hypothetical protein